MKRYAYARLEQKHRYECQNNIATCTVADGYLLNSPLQGADLNIRRSEKEVDAKPTAQGRGSRKTDEQGVGRWVTQPVLLPVFGSHGRRLE